MSSPGGQEVGRVKRCTLCSTDKHVSDFAKNSRSRDGRNASCKSCRRDRYQLPARERGSQVQQHLDGTQTCRVCGLDKHVSEFHWRSDNGKYRSECKGCLADKGKQYWVVSGSQLARSRNLRIKYGITTDKYDELLSAQGGGCAICGGTDNPDATSLAVDHCHITGRIRGILCGPCNKAIGLMKDNPVLLTQAAAYLGGDQDR